MTDEEGCPGHVCELWRESSVLWREPDLQPQGSFHPKSFWLQVRQFLILIFGILCNCNCCKMFKSFQIQVLAILSFILCFTAAQSILPDPSTCADSNVTFDGCKILEAKSAECGSISVDDQTELIACFCTQEVYSSIIK